jgi:hypothetical protein
MSRIILAQDGGPVTRSLEPCNKTYCSVKGWIIWVKKDCVNGVMTGKKFDKLMKNYV